jgi:hypothetical protein
MDDLAGKMMPEVTEAASAFLQRVLKMDSAVSCFQECEVFEALSAGYLWRELIVFTKGFCLSVKQSRQLGAYSSLRPELIVQAFLRLTESSQMAKGKTRDRRCLSIAMQ